jgi:predicted SAM-dependent methyltransferase
LRAPAEWRNFDSSARLRFEQLPVVGIAAGLLGRRLFPENIAFGNIVSGLPLPDGSAHAIYASHVLEHLCRADISRALANTVRILKPGGLFRIIVPDLEWRAKRYVAATANGDATAADDFISSCHIGQAVRPRGLLALLRAAYGNSGHMWMYDYATMTRLLAEAGFVDIRRCEMGDSGDPMFDKVEDRGRFIDSGENELALQARKP